ncbi:MAG TPA: FAD-dependent monooxygenase [Burkholderiales bacterium]|jgi:2-octaprenyl-6-methoxyphenol hydroxylase|nr:FAD-dependent monooxygenase [Burkholderiales bacterium]
MPAPGTDVLIRGAGPVGCALALALRGSHLKVAILGRTEARAAFRPLALSHASRLILERLDVWPSLEATPIETIRVSQQQAFGRTVMQAADAGVPALGYVTEYSALVSLLQAKCEGLFVQGEVQARCVVHAEGSPPQAREKRYPQDALVAMVRTEPASGTTAFERFTPEGPLALLPLAGRYALIWSCRPERAAELASCEERLFLARLGAAAGRRPGVPVQVEDRALQPLALRVHPARVAQRAVYIGNAAQTLHPVAGQGLNLGLRDAWDLSRGFVESRDPGDAVVLARYAASRRFDARATIGVTDALAGAFLGANPLARAARGLALTALDLFPAPRRFFARRMIYGPSALP